MDTPHIFLRLGDGSESYSLTTHSSLPRDLWIFMDGFVDSSHCGVVALLF